jgi:hypothetical protein
MKNLNFGVIPTQRTRKTEKFTTPVLSMTAVAAGKKGAGRKFTFNKAAKQLLGLSGEADAIALAFDGSDIYLQMTHPTAEGSLQLTKTGSFSNKRIYNVVTKTLGLSNEVENYFSITQIPGENYYQLTPIGSVGLATPSTNPMPESVEVVEPEVEKEVVEEASEIEGSASEEEGEW